MKGFIEVSTEDHERLLLDVNLVESVQELKYTRLYVAMQSGEKHIIIMPYDRFQSLLKGGGEQ